MSDTDKMAIFLGNLFGPSDAELIKDRDARNIAEAQQTFNELPWATDVCNFQNQLKGKAYSPSVVEEYNNIRARVWNTDAAGYPHLIVCVSAENAVDDIRATLKFVRKHDIVLCIAGGYHSASCMKTGTLVMDMFELDQVDLNVNALTVKVGAGCKLGQIDEKLVEHGLGGVWGTNSDTGIAGLTLAGGLGWLTPMHGFGVDNMIEVEMVLPNGEFITVNDDNEFSDLMVGLRGAGVYFGVVTSFKFKVHYVGDVLGGLVVSLCPTQASAVELVDAMVNHVQATPNTLGAMLVLPAGAPVVPQVWVDFSGKKLEENEDLQKAVKLGGWINVKNTVDKCNFAQDVQTLTDPMTLGGDKYMGVFGLKSLPLKAVELLVKESREHGMIKGCGGAFIVQFLKGKAYDKNLSATSCVPFRDAIAWAVCVAEWTGYDENGLKRESCKGWVHRTKKTLQPWLLETAHAVEADDCVRVYTKDILTTVKTLIEKYNPDRIVRGHKKAFGIGLDD